MQAPFTRRNQNAMQLVQAPVAVLTVEQVGGIATQSPAGLAYHPAAQTVAAGGASEQVP